MKIEWPNQNAHWLFSMGLVLGTRLWTPNTLWPAWLAVLFALLFGYYKEFCWDSVHGQDVEGTEVDFAFYALGAALGLGLVVLQHHIGK